jgi:hypothetical protein
MNGVTIDNQYDLAIKFVSFEEMSHFSDEDILHPMDK